MKYLISIFTFLTFLCIEANAQERFNNIYYDPDANLSNTVIAVPGGYVVLTGTSVDGGRGIGLVKISSSGNIIMQKDFKFEGLSTYEGENNCLKYDNSNGTYYCCGTAEDEEYNEYPFLILLDENLDTLRTYMLNIDSVYGAYNVIKQNDSIYAIVATNIIPDDYEMGLLLVNINNPENYIKKGYGVEELLSNEVGSIIVKTHDNFLLLGGFTFGFSTSTYKQDWYLVKTDSIGNMVWERYYGNPDENDGRVMAMLESRDTAYIVAGGQTICNWSMSPIAEACLRKIDTAGNLIWEKFYRRYGYDSSQEVMRYSNIYIGDIVELDNGDLIAITSYARADGGTLLLLLKLNNEGEIIWSRHMHTTDALGSNYCSSIKTTTDTGLIINGYGNFSTTYDPPQQFFLIKTDSLGCEGGLYPAPPPENVECPDFPGTMYCNGTYTSKLRVQGKAAPYTIEFSTGEVIEDLYYPPVFIPKSQGTGSFTVHVGVDTYNHSYDTATLYNPIPAEDTEPDMIELPVSITVPENYFGPELTTTITNGYGETYDITLPVYVDCNVSAKQFLETATVNIYPNPASDYLQVNLPELKENSFVKIINSLGQTVLVEQLQFEESKIKIGQLSKGNYIARIYCGNRIENLKFTKM